MRYICNGELATYFDQITVGELSKVVCVSTLCKKPYPYPWHNQPLHISQHVIPLIGLLGGICGHLIQQVARGYLGKGWPVLDTVLVTRDVVHHLLAPDTEIIGGCHGNGRIRGGCLFLFLCRNEKQSIIELIIIVIILKVRMIMIIIMIHIIITNFLDFKFTGFCFSSRFLTQSLHCSSRTSHCNCYHYYSDL